MAILEEKYIKKNVTKEWIVKNGFKYSRVHSEDDMEAYTYRFPVYKYGITTLLECELLMYIGSDTVIIDVYDCGTNNKYASFYYHEYGDFSPLLNSINKCINKKLKTFGIVKAGAKCQK